MAGIKTYRCDCGEDFYEDDANCCNCHAPIDKSKLKFEEVADITMDGDKMIVTPPPSAYADFDHRTEF